MSSLGKHCRRSSHASHSVQPKAVSFLPLRYTSRSRAHMPTIEKDFLADSALLEANHVSSAGIPYQSIDMQDSKVIILSWVGISNHLGDDVDWSRTARSRSRDAVRSPQFREGRTSEGTSAEEIALLVRKARDKSHRHHDASESQLVAEQSSMSAARTVRVVRRAIGVVRIHHEATHQHFVSMSAGRNTTQCRSVPVSMRSVACIGQQQRRKKSILAGMRLHSVTLASIVMLGLE